jgi:hypothetical protein
MALACIDRDAVVGWISAHGTDAYLRDLPS